MKPARKTKAKKIPLFRGRVEDGILHPQGLRYSFGVRPGYEIQTLTIRGSEFCLTKGILLDNTDPSTVTIKVGKRLVRTGRMACWPPDKWKPPLSPALRANLIAADKEADSAQETAQPKRALKKVTLKKRPAKRPTRALL